MEDKSFIKDRISALPDDLLTRIVSLLSAEEVFRTCILSKRWKRVWTSVPVLVFDDYEQLIHALTKEESIKREAMFESFVYSVLCHRENLPLDTFKLRFCNGAFSVSHPHFSEILSKAAYFMPRVLSICNRADELSDLFGLSFTFSSVEEMSLVALPGYDYDYLRAESVNLHRLKILELANVNFDDEFLQMLFSGCPVLEELVFCNCWLNFDEISSTVLKKLTIRGCYQLGEIVISCPDVVSLGISCYLVGITLNNMPSLITADLSFKYKGYFDYEEFGDLKFLNSFSNVASLRLVTTYSDIMDLLVEDVLNCPILNNLKILELGVLDMNIRDWNLVISLLERTPNLKTLTLQFSQPSEDAMEQDILGDVPFQLEYLETVKLGFEGRNDELAEEVVRTLRVLIKTIGKVIILWPCERPVQILQYQSEDRDVDAVAYMTLSVALFCGCFRCYVVIWFKL